MPEILTKHPDVVLTILKDAGAKCGVGAKQQILMHCPKEQFCALPTGELCIYDVPHIESMTQFSPADIADITQTVPTIYSSWNILLLGAACLFGMLFGMMLKR